MNSITTGPSIMHRELIARVEKCTGPDREIDLAVHRAVRSCVVPSKLAHLENVNSGTAFHDSAVHETGYCLGDLPRYTASLDSVVALVERELPGHSIALCLERIAGTSSSNYGAMVKEKIPRWTDWAHGEFHTGGLALALLLAFLRAKSNQWDER